MKLPDSSLLKDTQMKLPYEYDKKELFNLDQRNVNRFRYETKLNLVLDMVGKAKQVENVVDVGCGQGNYTLSIAANGIYSIGIDLRRPFLKYAKMKAEEIERANADFLIANAECLPFKFESIRCVYIGELLEHLSEPDKVLREVKRVSKSGNSFSIISTPNVERFGKKRMRTYTSMRLMAKNKIDTLKYGADTHVFEFTREELLSLLSKYFRITSFKYLWLAPPLSLLYKVQLSPILIRRIETKLLSIRRFAQKSASDMFCVIIQK